MNLLQTIEQSPSPVTWGDLKRANPDLDHYRVGIELEQLRVNGKIEIDETGLLTTFAPATDAGQHASLTTVWMPEAKYLTCARCFDTFTTREDKTICSPCGEK